MIERLRLTRLGRASWVFLLWPFIVVLLADRGRLNADTKYDLTVAPRRLIDASLSTWDEVSHGGWVLQQHAGYLWPTGPFFSVTDTLPDWVQQRLWLALIIVAGGIGARWAARTVGITPAIATLAGLIYQCSPYLVPYLARTSAMLLPWAIVGWLFGASVRATHFNAPRWVAVMALLIATAGGVNTTAIAMVSWLPIAVFFVAYRNNTISGQRFSGLSLATTAAALLTSSWWVASAVIGARYGPDLLGFSETVRDVSSTSTGLEVFRGAGYWLSYVVEPDGSPTSAAGQLLTEQPFVIAATFGIALLGLIGAITLHSPHRRLFATLMVISVVFAIGIHPYDSPSPFGRIMLDWLPGGALSAFRSSTRALPIWTLVIALGCAQLLSRVRASSVVIAPTVALTSVAAPWFMLGYVVDPVLERPSTPPATWETLLDGLDDVDRVLVLPGTEFSTFEWGHTQDPPWTSHTSVITRELLPLGSPDRMDLLLALDDSLQDGVIDVDAIADTATLIGADAVWVATDVNLARYRTQPLLVNDVTGANGLQLVSAVEGVGGLFIVAPGAHNGAAESVALWGGGRGAVDALAAGVVSSHDTLWRPETAPDGVKTVITDGDRDAVRQWRTSQATRGATSEPSDAGRDGVNALTEPDPTQTVVRWGTSGQWTITASTYGSGLELEPERRAAMAVDGNPTTAWTVEDPSSRPSLSISGPLTTLVPVATALNGGITELEVKYLTRGEDGVRMVAAHSDGSFPEVELPADTYAVEVTISQVAPGTRDAGLSEILPEPVDEIVVVPPLPDSATDVVLTRWRVNRPDLGRTDPENVLRRAVQTPVTREMMLSVEGLAHRDLAEGEDVCIGGIVFVDEVDVPVSQATGHACNGEPLTFDAGEHIISSTANRVILRDLQPHDDNPCCVTRLGRAYAEGWSAEFAGESITPVSLIGGEMAVVTTVDAASSEVALEWSPDRWYRWSLIISALSAVIALFVIVIDPGRPIAAPQASRRVRSTSRLSMLLDGAIVGVAIFGLVGWKEALVAAGITVIIRRPLWLFTSGVFLSCALVIAEATRDKPSHGIAWPGHFEILHGPFTAAIVALGIIAIVRPDETGGRQDV
ncbi:MAG: alpha-(1-_3)-arabinofuranosyltransferase domain-containing protein [Ilumatobacteraceae bacterium]